jgi:nitronate monooxygenase
VDFVLMGAGIPREIPAVLDAFAQHQPASLRLDLEGAAPDRIEYLRLDPAEYWDKTPGELKRPMFLPIIASNSLATMMVRKATGRVDGFVIEGPTAGGHNAPPRGGGAPDEWGNVAYGPRDAVDLGKIRELGLPFWVAGGEGSPQRLRDARAAGAAGIQVGTLFAYCDESGIDVGLRSTVLRQVARGEVEVRTDSRASPTGYPFKVVRWGAAATVRERVCDLGYLRTAYAMSDGRIGYRCPSEPEGTFVAKGGSLADTVGRMCLCNSLLATIGLAQARDRGQAEPLLLTSGDILAQLGGFLAGRTRYSAADAISYLLGADRG